MKNILFPSLILSLFIVSCNNEDYIIGGDSNESNEVDMTTFEFLSSFEETTETASLFEMAGLTEVINGDVTVIAPSNYAINRYLRRQTNRRQRINPDSAAMTIEDIPDSVLSQLKMYIVDGQYSMENIPEEGVTLSTKNPGDTLRLLLRETGADPGAAWDGGSTPGQGYQYLNFMQTSPKLVFVHFKRGDNWEMEAQERVALGYDDPECDQVYSMLISDVITTRGVVHVIYSGNYNYSDHYYYHTLFFFGTRADDLL